MKHARGHLLLVLLIIYSLSAVCSIALLAFLNNIVGFLPLRDPTAFGFLLIELLITAVTFAFFVVMGYLMSKRVVRPYVIMSQATQEVAKGDFSVQIQENTRGPVEMKQLQHNFNIMTRELQYKDKVQKDFIANVSHEYKSPIAAVQGYTRLLMEEGLSPAERQKYGNVILNESDRLLSMASNIMELSQLENTGIRESVSSFWLDEQIRDTVLKMEPVWAKKEISFDINLEQVKVAGYHEHYEQIWTNLIGNAVKFSHPSGSISISMYMAGGMIKATVSDEGSGMDADTLTHIFERFYQEDTSRKNGGNGLGLAIVKQIVESSGGTISVKSEPGQGAAFFVELPVHQSDTSSF